MNKIENLLKTPQGAKALKAKLKSMPKNEKEKPNYQKLWKLVCAKVSEYNLKKMKPNDQSTQKKKPSAEKPKKSQKVQDESSEKTIYLHRPPKGWNKVDPTIILLEKKYPKLFNINNPKPLKIGIADDLMADHQWDEKEMSAALKYYVQSEKYYASFLKNTHRCDLMYSNFKVACILRQIIA